MPYEEPGIKKTVNDVAAWSIDDVAGLDKDLDFKIVSRIPYNTNDMTKLQIKDVFEPILDVDMSTVSMVIKKIADGSDLTSKLQSKGSWTKGSWTADGTTLQYLVSDTEAAKEFAGTIIEISVKAKVNKAKLNEDPKKYLTGGVIPNTANLQWKDHPGVDSTVKVIPPGTPDLEKTVESVKAYELPSNDSKFDYELSVKVPATTDRYTRLFLTDRVHDLLALPSIDANDFQLTINVDNAPDGQLDALVQKIKDHLSYRDGRVLTLDLNGDDAHAFAGTTIRITVPTNFIDPDYAAIRPALDNEGWLVNTAKLVWGPNSDSSIEKQAKVKPKKDTVDLTIVKRWEEPVAPVDDKTVTVIVKRNGAQLGNAYSITKGDAEPFWTLKVNGLDKYDENGRPYNYTVEETAVDGQPIAGTNGEPTYIVSANKDEESGVWTITNRERPQIKLIVEKTWELGDKPEDQALKQPVTVFLYKNGEKTDRSVVLSDANNWRDETSFTGLYTLTEDGQEIVWTAKEEPIAGLKSDIKSTPVEGGLQLTFTNSPDRPTFEKKINGEPQVDGVSRYEMQSLTDDLVYTFDARIPADDRVYDHIIISDELKPELTVESASVAVYDTASFEDADKSDDELQTAASKALFAKAGGSSVNLSLGTSASKAFAGKYIRITVNAKVRDGADLSRYMVAGEIPNTATLDLSPTSRIESKAIVVPFEKPDLDKTVNGEKVYNMPGTTAEMDGKVLTYRIITHIPHNLRDFDKIELTDNFEDVLNVTEADLAIEGFSADLSTYFTKTMSGSKIDSIRFFIEKDDPNFKQMAGKDIVVTVTANLTKAAWEAALAAGQYTDGVVPNSVDLVWGDKDRNLHSEADVIPPGEPQLEKKANGQTNANGNQIKITDLAEALTYDLEVKVPQSTERYEYIRLVDAFNSILTLPALKDIVVSFDKIPAGKTQQELEQVVRSHMSYTDGNTLVLDIPKGEADAFAGLTIGLKVITQINAKNYGELAPYLTEGKLPNTATLTVKNDATPITKTVTVTPEGANVQIVIKKSWIGGQPDATMNVSFKVLRDGSPLDEAIVMNATNGWTKTLELPKYKLNGEEYVYTVVEDRVWKTGDANGTSRNIDYAIHKDREATGDVYTYSFTNTERTKIDIPVEKKWFGEDGHQLTANELDDLPEVTVFLYKDGVKTEKKVVLNKANSWTDRTTFTGLYTLTEDGQPISWTVKEEPVDGWSTRIINAGSDTAAVTFQSGTEQTANSLGYVVKNRPDEPTLKKSVNGVAGDVDGQPGQKPAYEMNDLAETLNYKIEATVPASTANYQYIVLKDSFEPVLKITAAQVSVSDVSAGGAKTPNSSLTDLAKQRLVWKGQNVNLTLTGSEAERFAGRYIEILVDATIQDKADLTPYAKDGKVPNTVVYDLGHGPSLEKHAYVLPSEEPKLTKTVNDQKLYNMTSAPADVEAESLSYQIKVEVPNNTKTFEKLVLNDVFNPLLVIDSINATVKGSDGSTDTGLTDTLNSAQMKKNTGNTVEYSTDDASLAKSFAGKTIVVDVTAHVKKSELEAALKDNTAGHLVNGEIQNFADFDWSPKGHLRDYAHVTPPGEPQVDKTVNGLATDSDDHKSLTLNANTDPFTYFVKITVPGSTERYDRVYLTDELSPVLVKPALNDIVVKVDGQTTGELAELAKSKLSYAGEGERTVTLDIRGNDADRFAGTTIVLEIPTQLDTSDFSKLAPYLTTEGQLPNTATLKWSDKPGRGSTTTVKPRPDKVRVQITKEWTGIADTSDYEAEVAILRDGSTVATADGSAIVLNQANGWSFDSDAATAQFPDGLPRYSKDGKEYVYTVEETAIRKGGELQPLTGFIVKTSAADPVVSTVASGEDEAIKTQVKAYSFTISNTERPVIDIPVKKVWEAIPDGTPEADKPVKPDAVTIRLYKDGVATDKTIVLNDGNGWGEPASDATTFKGLETLTADNKEVKWTVKEDAVDGWAPVITVTGEPDATVEPNDQRGYTITNRPDIPGFDKKVNGVDEYVMDGLNDALEYVITTDVPESTDNYDRIVVTDSFEPVLSIESHKVEVFDKGSDAVNSDLTDKASQALNVAGRDLDLTLTGTTADLFVGKKIVITVSARVDQSSSLLKNYLVKGDIPNTANLKLKDGPGTDRKVHVVPFEEPRIDKTVKGPASSYELKSYDLTTDLAVDPDSGLTTKASEDLTYRIRAKVPANTKAFTRLVVHDTFKPVFDIPDTNGVTVNVYDVAANGSESRNDALSTALAGSLERTEVTADPNGENGTRLEVSAERAGRSANDFAGKVIELVVVTRVKAGADLKPYVTGVVPNKAFLGWNDEPDLESEADIVPKDKPQLDKTVSQVGDAATALKDQKEIPLAKLTDAFEYKMTISVPPTTQSYDRIYFTDKFNGLVAPPDIASYTIDVNGATAPQTNAGLAQIAKAALEYRSARDLVMELGATDAHKFAGTTITINAKTHLNKAIFDDKAELAKNLKQGAIPNEVVLDFSATGQLKDETKVIPPGEPTVDKKVQTGNGAFGTDVTIENLNDPVTYQVSVDVPAVTDRYERIYLTDSIESMVQMPERSAVSVDVKNVSDPEKKAELIALASKPENLTIDTNSRTITLDLNKADADRFAGTSIVLTIQTKLAYTSYEELLPHLVRGKAPNTARLNWSHNGNSETTVYVTPKKELAKVEVKKTWLDAEGTETTAPSDRAVTVTVKRNDGKSWSLKLDSANSWTATVSDDSVAGNDKTLLPKRDAQGRLYTYTVTEDKVETTDSPAKDVTASYKASVSGPVESTETASVEGTDTSVTRYSFSVANAPYTRIDIPVKKVWAEAPAGTKPEDQPTQPESVTIRLYNGDEATDKTVVLDASNKWGTDADAPVAFTDLLVKEENGTVNQWNVREDHVAGYKTTVTNTDEPQAALKFNNEKGYTITNTPDIPGVDKKINKKDEPYQISNLAEQFPYTIDVTVPAIKDNYKFITVTDHLVPELEIVSSGIKVFDDAAMKNENSDLTSKLSGLFSAEGSEVYLSVPKPLADQYAGKYIHIDYQARLKTGEIPASYLVKGEIPNTVELRFDNGPKVYTDTAKLIPFEKPALEKTVNDVKTYNISTETGKADSEDLVYELRVDVPRQTGKVDYLKLRDTFEPVFDIPDTSGVSVAVYDDKAMQQKNAELTAALSGKVVREVITADPNNTEAPRGGTRLSLVIADKNGGTDVKVPADLAGKVVVMTVTTKIKKGTDLSAYTTGVVPNDAYLDSHRGDGTWRHQGRPDADGSDRGPLRWYPDQAERRREGEGRRRPEPLPRRGQDPQRREAPARPRQGIPREEERDPLRGAEARQDRRGREEPQDRRPGK